jgi:hypothetical protein
MKKVLSITAAAFALLAVTATTQAQIITSLEFGDSSSAKIGSNSAGEGIYSVSHWNDIVTGPATAYTQSFSAPVNYNLGTSTVGTSTITGTIYSAGNYNQSAPGAGGTFTTGDFALATGYALAGYGGTTKVTLTLNGLKAGDTYNLIAYDYDAGTSLVTATATDGTTTGTEYFGKNTAALNTYVLGYASSAAYSAGTASNYLSYTGLTGSTTLTLNLQESGSNFYGLEGVQLIDTTVASVPEPSSVWLFSLGLLGLGLHLRRKRSVVI